MSRYLVTGAAGFIGSALANALIGNGHKVWTIDNLSTGFKENIPDDVLFVEGECQSDSTIRQLKGRKFDAIFHLAGQSSGEVSFDDPVYDLRTNTEATLRLIKYGLETGCKRFIYASSMSVYGSVEDRPIAEEYKTQPKSFYGVGKLSSENYLKIYQSYGLIPTALRFFNVYGPGQNMQNLRQGMVSIYLAQLLQKNEIIVKGSLDRFRDFIYIDDCVDFMCNIIDYSKTYGAIYNVGTGIRTTVDALIHKMMAISGIEKPITVSGETPGDQKGIYADISKAKAEIGFNPKYTLEQGLDLMILWAKKWTDKA
jgi:UDP-glucose 4-epimerase